MTTNFIIPPYLLQNLIESESRDDWRAHWQTMLDHDQSLRAARAETPTSPSAARQAEPGAEAPQRTVYDAGSGTELPGRQVRAEGDPAVDDVAVNQAYDGTGATWKMFWECFGRDSIDGAGLPLQSTVHYDRSYNNAFWDGNQMVFGDGDGEIFQSFTNAVDVTGHELTHGVTQHTAALEYQGQSGALNESVSDVFGSLAKQYELGQTAEEADWIIGSGLLTDQVDGVGLRSMKDPGSAYDDPRLGKDPQPGHMDDYVQTTDDNGGVHINSGIPNKAFYLAATKIGGNAWEGAGQIWYKTITSGTLSKTADFAEFAQATQAAAKELYGEGSKELTAVSEAWQEVGVVQAGQATDGQQQELSRFLSEPGRGPGPSPTPPSVSTVWSPANQRGVGRSRGR
jgi:Zn-dependent metalloprotease